jgi:hypothetical protein
MAQRKKQKLIIEHVQADALSLDGLEPLLENGAVELAQPTEALDFSPVETTYSETGLILDLLAELEGVNTLVLETSRQLMQTKARVQELETLLMGEEILVARIKELEGEVQRVIELETWLDALKVENASLKRPWWKKMLGLA